MSIRLSFVAALMILFAGCEREPAPSPDEPTRHDRRATPQEWPTGLTPGGPRTSPLVPSEPPEPNVPPPPPAEPTPRELPTIPATQIE